MRKAEESAVATKTYELILWSCNHTSKFPRNHRFVLGERIERNLYGLLETLIAAKYTKDRRRLLEDANLSLEILRFQMRLAKDLQWLKVESYASVLRSARQALVLEVWSRSAEVANRHASLLRPVQGGISPRQGRFAHWPILTRSVSEEIANGILADASG